MVKYNKKIIISGALLISAVTLAVIGLTYAFFTATVQGNASATNTVVQTGILLLEFNDTQVLNMNNALPGESTSKTFTVKNTGNVRQKYDIDLINVTNTFINNELIYTITSNNIDGGEVINQVVPTEETTLLTSYIDPGVTITYTMTVKFKETGSDQSANQGATFSGKLQIIPRIMGVALGGYVYGDDDNILPGVTVELHSDPIITTTDSNGYYEIKDAPVGIHTLYIKQGETTLGSKEINLISSTESKIENEEIKLPDKMKTYINIKVDDGLNISLKPLEVMKKILADNTARSDISINFANVSSDTNGKGLYYTENLTYAEDDTRIYYFRGRVENNWVSLGGYLWRIVRTTSEGGLKLVYSGDGNSTSSGFIGISGFQSISNNRYYIGYTYNTSKNGYTGTQTSSVIKTVVDNWYITNLSSYVNYLSTTAIYCNDRSSDRTEGSLIYFPAYDRILTNKRPTYACPSTNASRYTVNASTGNGYLTYPIALLTIDEINFGGLTYVSDNLTSYLRDNATGGRWWAMSPSHIDSYGNSVGFYDNVYNILALDISNICNVRPVVSLKPDVKFTGGNGTKSDPYVVE